MKKKILIFTGSRADYGVLKPLISRIKRDKRYKFLIAAGSHHFSKNLGFTYKEIIKDNFKINYACQVKIKNTTFSDVSQYCGNSISENSRYLENYFQETMGTIHAWQRVCFHPGLERVKRNFSSKQKLNAFF